MADIKVIGRMDHTIDHTLESANRVYDISGICPTIPTCSGGGICPKVMVKEYYCVASRGRNPDNPSDRTKGIHLEQRLEVREDECINNLTTVAKDNYIMEKETVMIKQATKEGYIECEVGGVADLSYPTSKTRRGRVIDKGNICPTLQTDGEICRIEKVGQISSDGSQYGIVCDEKGLAPTLSAGTHGYANSCIHQKYRIRKLTPKECFRLMNFDDEDFFAAESVNSDTQLFKQAGNSIVVACLCALFSQLNIQGINPWNKMSESEKKRISAINECDNPNFERNPI